MRRGNPSRSPTCKKNGLGHLSVRRSGNKQKDLEKVKSLEREVLVDLFRQPGTELMSTLLDTISTIYA